MKLIRQAILREVIAFGRCGKSHDLINSALFVSLNRDLFKLVPNLLEISTRLEWLAK